MKLNSTCSFVAFFCNLGPHVIKSSCFTELEFDLSWELASFSTYSICSSGKRISFKGENSTMGYRCLLTSCYPFTIDISFGMGHLVWKMQCRKTYVGKVYRIYDVRF